MPSDVDCLARHPLNRRTNARKGLEIEKPCEVEKPADLESGYLGI